MNESEPQTVDMPLIDQSATVFAAAVRPEWSSTGLTFVGIVYAAAIALTALLVGALPWRDRVWAAGCLVALGVVTFWPARFWLNEQANRYLKSAGRLPKG